MYYHIILTEKCNMKCKYCYEKSMNEWDNGLESKWDFNYDAPADSEVDVMKLKNFIDKDEEPVLIFYGGEPLLEVEKIIKIIDVLGDKVRYCMQTNGKLLPKLPIEYLKKIDKMLVSIDGDEQRTDWNRGKNTYKIVVNNLKKIREAGYSGEVVARMTLSFPDVDYQVEHLVSLVEEGIFDSIHWQMDVGFYKNDYNYEIFSEFVKEYNKQIEELIDFWIDYMKEKKKVLKLYPFMGLFESLFYGKKTRLRCGAGYKNYTISTDGTIVACPIMNNVETFCAGSIDDSPSDLKEFDVGEPCTSCSYKNVCGGRCLYVNKAKLWPPEGEKLVCGTIIHTIEALKSRIEDINALIYDGIVSEKDFEYEKYFGPEIIP